jgi:hypothetical protein
VFETLKQRIDIVVQTIGRQTGPSCARDTEGMSEGLRAMVATPQCHPAVIKLATDFLGRMALDAECDHAATVVRIDRPH